MKYRFVAILISLSLLTLSACSNEANSADCSQLVVEDAWVREAPPGVSVMAAYMRVRNTGDQVVTITAASSATFERIEFHQTQQNDGRMKMQALQLLEVAANSDLLLEPGGRHMMLFAPRHSPKSGERLDIELRCASQGKIVAEFAVKKTPVNGNSAHQHHHH